MNDDDSTLVSLNQVNAEFTEATEPKDERMLELLRNAYTKKSQCRQALVPVQMIVPFSSFVPTTSAAQQQAFADNIKQKHFPPLMVYERESAFVMSDDYPTYYMYKKSGVTDVPCIVLNPGELTAKSADVSPPYYLEF